MVIRQAITAILVLSGFFASQTVFASLDTDPYIYDTSFDQGHAIDDRFAATTTENEQLAQKLVRLSDGDIVVAGLVPAAFQPNQGNGGFNLGLVRYGGDGSRVPWANPTPAFSYFDNMYVDYPNNSQAGFTAVRDIKAVGGYIYVLLDVTSISGNQDVSIVAFSESGAIVGDYPGFSTSLFETGAGIATYSVPDCDGVLSCIKLIAVATYAQPSGRAIITAKRFVMGNDGPPGFTPNGTLSVDTAYGPFGNGANDYSMPDLACMAQTQCSVRAAGVAAVRTHDGTPTLYVGAESLWSATDRDAVALAIDGNSGDALTSFGSSGFSWNPIDAGGDDNDITVGVVASEGADSSTDRIYTLSNVSLPCTSSSGIGVVKIVGGSGGKDMSFGDNGKLVFGGDTDPNCDSSSAVSDIPFGLALDGDRLAIVGQRGAVDVLIPIFGPLFSIVRASDGNVANRFTQIPTRLDGAPWGTYYLRDVIASGDGRFTSTGYLIDQDLTKPLFGTARYASDRIFGDGFD